MDARDDGDADDPDRESERPCTAQPLVREEAKDEQRVEDRDGGLDDCGQPGVDVLLAPRDQPEGKRRVENAQDEAVAPGGAKLAERAGPAEAPDDVADQHRRREQRAHGHHRRRCDLVDGDLDEEVGRSPDGREEDQHRRVAIHLRTLPVPSATPASTSARPAMLSAVTFSSRKTAP